MLLKPPALLPLILLFFYPSLAIEARPLIGVIRWDAYVGPPNTVGLGVEQALSPAKYHDRVPFYGVEASPVSIQARETQQAVMDQEITYAEKACIDYWVFDWYPPHSGGTPGMETARNLYLSSTLQNKVKFCLILSPDDLDPSSGYAISVAEIISNFKRPNYVKVKGDRPLLYLLGTQFVSATGVTCTLAPSMIDPIRRKAPKAGCGNPYIVLLRTDSNYHILSELGLDALSMYATTWIGHGAPYKDLASADINDWNFMIGMGYRFVPHVTMGWDNRPLHDHPQPWYPDPGPDSWVAPPKPEEAAAHLKEAITWAAAHPDQDDANTALIYAWNEFVEGGFICPTLPKYGGTSRLDAIGRLLCGPRPKVSGP